MVMDVAVGEPIAQFEIGDYRNFIYLILDWTDKRAAIVDPQVDLALPLAVLQKHGFRLDAIFLTHTHHDHVAGLDELVRLFPEIQIVVHELELHRLAAGLVERCQLHKVVDSESIAVGGLSVKVLHTPGHSAGECCYQLHDYLFTGDTVFVRDCGRTDFSTGSAAQMFHSLQRLKTLAPQTIFLPGHHYAPECTTTLERELKDSPPFTCKSVAELEELP